MCNINQRPASAIEFKQNKKQKKKKKKKILYAIHVIAMNIRKNRLKEREKELIELVTNTGVKMVL